MHNLLLCMKLKNLFIQFGIKEFVYTIYYVHLCMCAQFRIFIHNCMNKSLISYIPTVCMCAHEKCIHQNVNFCNTVQHTATHCNRCKCIYHIEKLMNRLLKSIHTILCTHLCIHNCCTDTHTRPHTHMHTHTHMHYGWCTYLLYIYKL